MKLCNICVDGKTHLCVMTEKGLVDVSACGFEYTLDDIIRNGKTGEIEAIVKDAETVCTENLASPLLSCGFALGSKG